MNCLKIVSMLMIVGFIQMGCYTTFGSTTKTDSDVSWYGEYVEEDAANTESEVFEQDSVDMMESVPATGVSNYFYNNHFYESPDQDDYFPDWSLSMSFTDYPTYWNDWSPWISWRWHPRSWYVPDFWSVWDYYDPYGYYPVVIYPWYPVYNPYPIYWDAGGGYYGVNKNPGKKRDWDKRGPIRPEGRQPVDRNGSGTTLVGGSSGSAASTTSVSRTNKKDDKPIRLKPRRTVDRSQINKTRHTKRNIRKVIHRRTTTKGTHVTRTRKASGKDKGKAVKRTQRTGKKASPSYRPKRSGNSGRSKSSSSGVSRSRSSSSGSTSTSGASRRTGRSSSRRR